MCSVIKEGELFGNCRKVVTNYMWFYKNCIYDSCGSVGGGGGEGGEFGVGKGL